MYTISVSTKIEYQFNNNESDDEKMKVIKKIEKLMTSISLSRIEVTYTTFDNSGPCYKLSGFIGSKVIGEPSQEITAELYNEGQLYFSNYEVIRELYKMRIERPMYESPVYKMINWAHGKNTDSPKTNILNAIELFDTIIDIMQGELEK